MLSRYDDYPIHQTAESLTYPATGDPDFYDRYFFNGFTREGDLFFAVALGVYPNRRVMDASFSVVRDGRQASLHASRLAPAERTRTRVGPLSVEVIEPMRVQRVVIEPNEVGLGADLTFRARTAALEEPRMTRRPGTRAEMDATRFTQFGAWTGEVAIEGTRVAIAPARVLGVRDRSWGIRPVGERIQGAPGFPPQFFWLWSPIHFDDCCTHFGLTEDGEGRITHANGIVVPTYASPESIPDGEEPRAERAVRVAHRVRWQPGTRRARSAEIELVPLGSSPRVIALEPILTFQMLGLGYLHPEWGHGLWKGEEALAGESWKLDTLNPLDPRHVHVEQLCRARMGERQGIGVLEQLVIGPHQPSGLTSLFDGAP